MATLNITDQDRADAAVFLQQYLSEALPDGDFSRGSFLYDLVINAMSYTVAYLRAEASLIRDRVSLNRVQGMDDTVDRDEAADDLLSNWFLTRKTGRLSRGTIRVYVTQKVDILIPAQTRFYYDSTRIFVPDYTQSKMIAASDIIDVVAADTSVAARYFELAVVAQTASADYDVDPARWSSWDAFSPYVSRVESLEAFAGGSTIESTDDFLARAKDAVSTRDLTTARSARTILKDQFATVDDVYVAGAGTPEMQRDLSPPYIGFTQFHMGGHADLYVKGPVVADPQYTATVGGTFTEDQPEVVNFMATDIADFTVSVVPGAVVKIYDNPDSTDPVCYVVQAVHPKFLVVDRRNPFTSERSGAQFSIGTNYPTFDNIYSTRTTGSLTRQFKLPRTIKLPATPIYYVSSVTWFNTGVGSWQSLTRNVLTNAEQPTLGALEYRISYSDPQYAFSGYQTALLECGSSVADGDSIRVNYETLSGFPSVHAYVVDTYTRTVASNTLVRGMFPVYLRFGIKYKLVDPVDTLTAADISAGVTTFINTFPASEELHVSKITGYIMSTWGSRLLYATPYVGSNLFTVAYDLYAPDGSVVSYTTQGAIQVSAASIDGNGAYVTNEVVQPPRLPEPITDSISSKNVMYVTSQSLITAVAE